MRDSFSNKYRHFKDPKTQIVISGKGIKMRGRNVVTMDPEGTFVLTDKIDVIADYGSENEIT